MKLKNIFQIMGFKGKAKRYSYTMHDYPIREGVVIHYAQWNHPRELKKTFSADLIDGYAPLLNEGDFCVDIGAHSGDSTLPMALAVGKTGAVLALEPNPYVYHVLEKNARANQEICNILTLQAAAGTEEGVMEFEYSDAGFCNGGRHEGMSVMTHGHPFKLPVFAVNMERELRTDYATYLPKLKFIKVDAEGYDLFVIKSLAGIIKEFRPVVKAEIFKKATLEYRKELLAFFEDQDYEVFKIDEEPAQTGEKLSVDSFTVGQHYDVLCLPKST